MQKRPEGPDPPRTTCLDVRRWLVACFLVLPDAPIYSASTGSERFLDTHVAPGSTFDWIRFSAEILGRNSRQRLYILTWARCEARRVAIAREIPNPPGGGTIADFCREFGVQRSTFDRSVERTCGLLARTWDNRRREP